MLDQRDELMIEVGDVTLHGLLEVPESARGVVVFVHGSGSSRMSPRNAFVADALNGRGLATLLFDLLTPEEEDADRNTGKYRFDVTLLTKRLEAVTTWLRRRHELSGLSVGLFGASTGAAAALKAAAEMPDRVRAVVSRGGRPDLALEYLRRVPAPTLLIVGGDDPTVLDLNRRALEGLRGPKALEIIPGATHLFQEPGALERVAVLAGEWFEKYL